MEYNAKGAIIAAHEEHLNQLPADAPNRTRPGRAMRPTRYSFEDVAIDGRPWDLRRLNGARHGVHYAPAELRPLFLQVLLDCLR